MLSHYGPGFSLVEIPGMSTEGAFTEAVKNVDGIAHIASQVVFQSDPKEVVEPAIRSAIGLLEAAAKKQSSQAACLHMEPNKSYHVSQGS